MSYTVIRVPLMQGLPLRTAGSMTMRSWYLMFSCYRRLFSCTRRLPNARNGRQETGNGKCKPKPKEFSFPVSFSLVPHFADAGIEHRFPGAVCQAEAQDQPGVVAPGVGPVAGRGSSDKG
jgi:hypothetical protein